MASLGKRQSDAHPAILGESEELLGDDDRGICNTIGPSCLSSGEQRDSIGAPFDTDEFYRQSCEAGFVKLDAVARNIAWTTATQWGDIEITINLSKPEKDPKAIAAAAGKALSQERAYVDPATGRGRSCPLCVEDADVECGYARSVSIGGEKWGLWYSPYAYYREHCIAMSWEHRPMHIDRRAFTCLFDIVDLFPQYFFGSNADIPIVGGSILGHDHFQGGRHVFSMQKAPVDRCFEIAGFPNVEAGIVKWPVSVIRLSGPMRNELIDAACHVLDVWCAYDDSQVGIVSGVEPSNASAMTGASTESRRIAFSDGAVKGHNTITPMLCMCDGAYQLDLALRCNVVSDAHPLGVFHPHEEFHHIKKENIGLIEVMGLAILPPRVQQVMEERRLSRDDVGNLFAQVLECAGVFKWDESGRSAFDRFVEKLS